MRTDFFEPQSYSRELASAVVSLDPPNRSDNSRLNTTYFPTCSGVTSGSESNPVDAGATVAEGSVLADSASVETAKARVVGAPAPPTGENVTSKRSSKSSCVNS